MRTKTTLNVEFKIKTLLKWQNETKIRQRFVWRWWCSLLILVDKSKTGLYSVHLSYEFSKIVIQSLCPGCRQECYNRSNTVHRQPFHSFPLLSSSAATQSILEDMFWYILSPVSVWPNTNTFSHSPLSPHIQQLTHLLPSTPIFLRLPPPPAPLVPPSFLGSGVPNQHLSCLICCAFLYACPLCVPFIHSM